MDIKVVGSGCSRCVSFAESVENIVKEVNEELSVERIFDLNEVRRLNIEKTPALIINGEVIFSGEEKSREELLKILITY